MKAREAMSSIEREEETMRVTGHFSPERSVVDINKVYPSILNTGNHLNQYVQADEHMQRLDARLRKQDDTMQQILSKLENFEELGVVKSSAGSDTEKVNDRERIK